MPDNLDSSWIWSNTHKAAGQILECENLWGQKRYRVWFPSLNTVLLQRPDEIEEQKETAETAKASLVQFAATAGRLLDLLNDDKLLAPVDSAARNRGQCAFSFIFLKTNWWQVDCGWNLREKGESHILTYFKPRDPSTDGTSAVRHLKTLSSGSTHCRLANSPQPEGAELCVFKHFKNAPLH